MTTPKSQTDFAVLSDPVILPSIKGANSTNVSKFRTEKVSSEFFILPRIKENSSKLSPSVSGHLLSDFDPEDDYDFDQDEGESPFRRHYLVVTVIP